MGSVCEARISLGDLLRDRVFDSKCEFAVYLTPDLASVNGASTDTHFRKAASEGCWKKRGLCKDVRRCQGQVAEGYLADVEFGARVVDIDTDQVARLVVIENNAFGNLAALDTGLV